MMDLDAIATLEKATEKYIRQGDMGPHREAARAVIDVFTLNADYALPLFEIVEKAIGIYDINHRNAEGRGVNKDSVTAVVKEMLKGRGDNKFLRVHKSCGIAHHGVYELVY